MSDKILVIRHGALGDIILSIPAYAAIRAHHPLAHITLLTTAPFAALTRRMPWFDRVEIDTKPAWWNPPGLLRLRRQLRGFDLVYDLQTSGRSTRYFRLAGRPAWSGIARGCSLPHTNELRQVMHTLERQRDQLQAAGLTDFPTPDLDWLAGETAMPAVPYALLVPGAAPSRPRKRWPAARFGELACLLVQRGLRPIIVGTAPEAPLAVEIRRICPDAEDWIGRTDIPALFTLARGAALAIGNDTGPMHLAALAGCPCIVMFSADSDPALTAPRLPDGSFPRLIRVGDLADLPVDGVAEALP